MDNMIKFPRGVCETLVYTSDISIRTGSIRKQSMTSSLGLAKIKQEFFFVLSFVRFLAYAYDNPYVAGLTSFLCFAFCFNLMLMFMFKCEPGFRPMGLLQTHQLLSRTFNFLLCRATTIKAIKDQWGQERVECLQ